ncbi:MAG: nucleotide exchange factor GrpE [Planctomycetota bacterium]|jgi:molecular chaperone GrpE (heat shock protein)
MFKKLVIPGLVLLLAGTAVLGWVLIEKNREQQKAADYKSKYGSEPDEYLKQYNEWLQSAPELRAYLPWGLDENGKPKTEAQLQQEQQERLKADLDILAAGKTDAYPFADILYGKNWQNELNEYKKRREKRESLYTASILCTFTGACCLLAWIAQLFTKAPSHLRKSVAVSLKDQRPNKDKKLAQADAKATIHRRKFVAVPLNGQRTNKDKKLAQADAKATIKPKFKYKEKAKPETETKAKVNTERKDKTSAKKLAIAKAEAGQKAKAEKQAKAEAEKSAKAQEKTRKKAEAEKQAKAKAEKLAKAQEKTRKKAEDEEKVSAKAEAKPKAKAERKAKAETEKLAKSQENAREKAKAEEKVGVKSDTLEDEVTLEKRQRPGDQVNKHSQGLRNSGFKSVETNSAGQTAVLIPDEKSVELVEALEEAAENMNVSHKLEDSLKEKTENLEKQMAEFKQMAQGVQKTALENSKPINNTLSELTEQMSAIREYAASQQTRLTKLQDGYDWNITKTFCLRVIRCIDNLEKRISQLTEKDMEAVDLEEVRDEMLFALESSGVEQFEPEINSDYHGQEKYAEAVKGKERCKDTNQTGKIAKIIRPGYQYFIDEENIKIVRPAQVKLFG